MESPVVVGVKGGDICDCDCDRIERARDEDRRLWLCTLVRDFFGDLEMLRGATMSLEYLSTSSESAV